jgi:hypothetical protein
MGLLGDLVLDSGLDFLDTDGDRLDICSEEPTDYTGATTTHTLGNKAPPAISAPADRGAGGREVTVSAITDGSVTGTGTASHWAVSDISGTALLATGPLAAPQGVTSGNTFTLTEFKVGIPDPA